MRREKAKKQYYNLLKQIRIDNNISQQNVADKIGISRQAISQFENGVDSLSLETIKRIQIVFKMDSAILSKDYYFEKTLKTIKIFLVSFSCLLIFILSIVFFYISLK